MLRRLRGIWVPDVLLALAFLGLGVADVFGELSPPSGTAPERTALVPVLLVSGMLALRRRAPLATVLVIATIVVAPTWPFSVRLVYWGEFAPWLFALYSAGRHLPRHRTWLAPLVSVLGFGLLLPNYPDLAEPGNALYDAGLMVVVWVIGMVVRNRAALRVENVRLDEERRDAERRAVAEERARIARELHDVIAHGVGVMVLQAGGARLGFDHDPEAAREALRRIEITGRNSLGELRLLLEVLRQEDLVADATEPQPTVQRLEALVADSRDHGLPVSLSVSPEATDLPLGLQLSAYRIVQEALPNVLKHAGCTPTEVSIGCNGSLTIDVHNDQGVGPQVEAPAGGHGLLGLAERVAVFGGTLRSGATAEGGYRLCADIPLPVESR